MNDRSQKETWDAVLQKLESHSKWRIYTPIISDTGKSHCSITSGWDCSSSGLKNELTPGLEQYMCLTVQKRRRISLHSLQPSTNSGNRLASHWSLWTFPRIWKHSACNSSGSLWTHLSKTANTWLWLITRLGPTTMMPVRWTVSFSTVLQRRKSAPVIRSLFEPRIQSLTHSHLGIFLTCSGFYTGW